MTRRPRPTSQLSLALTVLDLPGQSGEPVCRFYAATSKTQGLLKPSEECRRIG